MESSSLFIFIQRAWFLHSRSLNGSKTKYTNYFSVLKVLKNRTYKKNVDKKLNQPKVKNLNDIQWHRRTSRDIVGHLQRTKDILRNKKAEIREFLNFGFSSHKKGEAIFLSNVDCPRTHSRYEFQDFRRKSHLGLISRYLRFSEKSQNLAHFHHFCSKMAN